MASPSPAPRLEAADILSRLAHDLTQPLSTLEATTYYLELILRGDPRVLPQLEQLRRLVDQLSGIVAGAVRELEAERRDRTNSTSSELA
jgi:hypothetical protein